MGRGRLQLKVPSFTASSTAQQSVFPSQFSSTTRTQIEDDTKIEASRCARATPDTIQGQTQQKAASTFCSQSRSLIQHDCGKTTRETRPDRAPLGMRRAGRPRRNQWGVLATHSQPPTYMLHVACRSNSPVLEESTGVKTDQIHIISKTSLLGSSAVWILNTLKIVSEIPLDF